MKSRPAWADPGLSPRLRANPPCGDNSPNSPRAGRQQGSVELCRVRGGPCPCQSGPVRGGCSRSDRPTGCRSGWLGFRRGSTPCPLPPIPAGDVHRGHRPGPRHRPAAGSAEQQPGQPRLPLLRPPRVRQDHERPHPGALPQLREGPDGRPRAEGASRAPTSPAADPGPSTSSRSTPPAMEASTTRGTCVSAPSSRR